MEVINWFSSRVFASSYHTENYKQKPQTKITRNVCVELHKSRFDLISKKNYFQCGIKFEMIFDD